MKPRRFSAVFSVVAVLATGPGESAERASDRRQLTLLHTSDVHGQLLPYDDLRNTSARGSLAQIATMVEEVRSEVDHLVLVLDSGDTIQGNPLERFAHIRWGRPSPTIEAMKRIGYDAMAVGNHEFNFGLDNLRRAEARANFPFLSANTIAEETGKPAFPPHRIVESGDLRIGVLGLTTPNIPNWERPENYRGLQFEPMDEAARRWVPVLREQEECDLVVVLAHTGLEVDLASGESNGTAYENFGWRLTRVPGIDVLLTGHSHRDMAPRVLNGVIASQPQARARVLTRIDLELERVDGRWSIVAWHGDNLATEDAAPDEDFVAAFAATRRDVVAALDAPITTVTAPVSVAGCRIADCAATDLIHEAQLEASGAQLSLASLLSDRTPKLAPGPVSWRWVHGLYVYPNTLVAVRVTGQQVKDILEHAARYYDGLECESGVGCTVLTDPDVRRYNVDSMAGVDYRIDPTRAEGDRVRDLRYRGLAIDVDQTFTLVCNNYRAAGGGHFPHLDSAEVVWTSSKEVTEQIGEYLEHNDPWRPAVDGNWTVGPEVVAEREVVARGG
jgi:2',3'-cyclic-nucleotide 2'-phosphodiesterase/3'-nucleotidase